MKASRFTNLLFSLLFVGAGLFAAVFLYRDYQHFDKLTNEKTQLLSRSEVLKEESEAREKQLLKLKGDREYLQAIIRERLNYAKEDELVFRFEH